MRLIVGLGNPDPEYQWTPHNLGFLAVDELANRCSIRIERPEGKALVGKGKLAGEDVVLAKPQTYMNLSGISVRELLEKYELGPDDLLVLWDEVQLPFGTIRIDRKGSGGSHSGTLCISKRLSNTATTAAMPTPRKIPKARFGCLRQAAPHKARNSRSPVACSSVAMIEENLAEGESPGYSRLPAQHPAHVRPLAQESRTRRWSCLKSARTARFQNVKLFLRDPSRMRRSALQRVR